MLNKYSKVVLFGFFVWLIPFVRKLEAGFLKEGVLLGLVWFIIGIVLDLLLFMEGPMKMSFADYMMDIGLTYLIIPIVSFGFGYLLEQHRR